MSKTVISNRICMTMWLVLSLDNSVVNAFRPPEIFPESQACASQQSLYPRDRYFIIVLFATPFAVLGVFMNLVVFSRLILNFKRYGDSSRVPILSVNRHSSERDHGARTQSVTKPSGRLNANIYLCVMASADVVLCLCYVLIMTCDALAHVHRLSWLWKAWHAVIVEIFTMSRITQMVQAYILVCVSLERLIISVPWCNRHPGLRLMTNHLMRRTLIIVTISFCFLFRIVSYWALTVRTSEDCRHIELGYLEPYPTDLGMSSAYQLYETIVVPIIQIALPFCILLPCNIVILLYTRQNMERRNKARQARSVSVANRLHLQFIRIPKLTKRYSKRPKSRSISTQNERRSILKKQCNLNDGTLPLTKTAVSPDDESSCIGSKPSVNFLNRVELEKLVQRSDYCNVGECETKIWQYREGYGDSDHIDLEPLGQCACIRESTADHHSLSLAGTSRMVSEVSAPETVGNKTDRKKVSIARQPSKYTRQESSLSTMMSSMTTHADDCVHIDFLMTPLVLTSEVLVTSHTFRTQRQHENDQVRKATITCLTLITSFLICNAFSLFIFVNERIENNPLLFMNDNFEPTLLYTYSSDIISIMFMLNSATRPLLYLFTNKALVLGIRQGCFP